MRVLVIAHGYPPSGTGGAELYAEALATRMARGGDEVVVIAREHNFDAEEFRVRREQRDGVALFLVNNTFRGTTAFSETYDNPAVTAVVTRVIEQVRPEVAHVHHLTGMSTTIVDELAARAIPVVLTLHDYWLLCHRGQLFDESMTACSGPGESGCAACAGIAGSTPAAFAGRRVLRTLDRHVPAAGQRIRQAGQALAGTLSSDDSGRESSRLRLAHMRARFAKIAVALAPSAHVRDRFAAAGFPADRIRVSEYGVEVPPVAPHRREGPLRLGYLGALMISKAPHLLAEAVRECGPATATADFFGAPSPYHGDRAYSDGIAERLSQLGATVHGPVPHWQVARVFGAIDALVFPSVWEETSGIGAREALAAGVPVIASRIGGIPESVRDGVNGLLFAPGDVADLSRQIQRLADEPGLLERLRAGCHPPRTLADDVASTRAVYQGCLAARPSSAARAGGAERVAAVVLNYRTPEQTAVAATMLLRSTTPVEVLVVDNGDGVECRQALAAASDRVTVMATGSNTGFSGGCNAGIAEGLARGADAIWLVNSDVLVPPDCLDRLLAVMRAQPGIGILGPLVGSPGWSTQILSAGLDYDQFTGRMAERRVAPGAAVEEVAAVSGCAMLVRREVFEAIGPLPEEYFFGFEDIAYCQRARRRGFRVAIAGTARVFHEGAGSSGNASDRLYYAARNHLHLGSETPARSQAHRLGRQLAIASYNVARIATSSDGSLPERLAAVAEGFVDHARGRYGPR